MGNGVLVGSRRLNPSPGINTVTKTVTLAQLNAGHVLVPAYGACKYRVVGFLILPNGTFTTATDVRLSDTAGTPVDIATIAIADVVDNAQLGEDDPLAVLGAGWAAPLTGGKGIQIRKTGSAAAGGTNILVTLQYELVSGVNVGGLAA
jgi:hypothetical protein